MLDISAQTARRFILGRQGLWPGRRWQGLDGTERAMRVMEHLQLDPLAIMARAQDLMLHSRVIDYRIDDWATLTYEQDPHTGDFWPVTNDRAWSDAARRVGASCARG